MTKTIFVHTPTIENYIEVIEYALSVGMRWRVTGKIINTQYWHYWKHDTCVAIDYEIHVSSISFVFGRLGKNVINMDNFYNIHGLSNYKEILKEFV